MKMWRKSQLKNEWRKNHKVGARREVGRRPNWVYQQLKEKEVTRDE